MPQRVSLPLIGIRSTCSIRHFLGYVRTQGKACELTGPILQRRQLYLQRTVVHDFQDDLSVESGLNPRCRLVHAQADARIGAPAFDDRNQITRYLDSFVSHRQDELLGFQSEGLRFTHGVFWFQFLCAPEIAGAKRLQAVSERNLYAGQVLTQTSETEAKAQIDGGFSPLAVFQSRGKDQSSIIDGLSETKLGEYHDATELRRRRNRPVVLRPGYGESSHAHGCGKVGAGELNGNRVVFNLPDYAFHKASGFVVGPFDVLGADEAGRHSVQCFESHQELETLDGTPPDGRCTG